MPVRTTTTALLFTPPPQPQPRRRRGRKGWRREEEKGEEEEEEEGRGGPAEEFSILVRLNGRISHLWTQSSTGLHLIKMGGISLFLSLEGKQCAGILGSRRTPSIPGLY